MQHAGSISALNPTVYSNERVLFVQITNPPAIYEVNLVFDNKGFVAKIYKIPFDTD